MRHTRASSWSTPGLALSRAQTLSNRPPAWSSRARTGSTRAPIRSIRTSTLVRPGLDVVEPSPNLCRSELNSGSTFSDFEPDLAFVDTSPNFVSKRPPIWSSRPRTGSTRGPISSKLNFGRTRPNRAQSWPDRSLFLVEPVPSLIERSPSGRNGQKEAASADLGARSWPRPEFGPSTLTVHPRRLPRRAALQEGSARLRRLAGLLGDEQRPPLARGRRARHHGVCQLLPQQGDVGEPAAASCGGTSASGASGARARRVSRVGSERWLCTCWGLSFMGGAREVAR